MIGEQTSHTISIDSVFSVSANPGTTEIDAPNSVLLTDTVVNIVKSVTDVTTEDISDYDTFLVEYVLDEEQANYETLAKYVSFRVDGNETYINVSTIPQDYDAVIKVVVYGDMYDKYTITYNGVEYTYVEGFFYTNGKEFPVGGYEIVDLESGTGKITFRAKSGSPARELASISTEYRVEYNGLTYIYDNSVTKFMYNGVELPLRSYAADFIELELKHKSSEIVVDSKFTVEYDGKIYTYNPDFSQFLNNETDLPVVYYVVDWANSNVNLYDRTLNVQYDGTLKTFKVSYGNEYFYDAARKDFYYGANKLSEDIEGGYYWDNSPANYGLLYYKGTELAIATEYSLKYEGNTYIYDGTNFVYDAQTLFEGNYDWDTAKGIVYYVLM